MQVEIPKNAPFKEVPVTDGVAQATIRSIKLLTDGEGATTAISFLLDVLDTTKFSFLDLIPKFENETEAEVQQRIVGILKGLGHAPGAKVDVLDETTWVGQTVPVAFTTSKNGKQRVKLISAFRAKKLTEEGKIAAVDTGPESF